MPAIINSDDGVVSGSAGLKTSGANDGLLDFQSNGTRIAGITTSAFQVGTNNISAVNSLGFRNRIFNGDMRIDQRNAGASSTPAGDGYFVDRYRTIFTGSTKFTVGQNLNSLTSFPSGFVNYAGLQVATAGSIAAGDINTFVHYIEGTNVADLGWGTANAQTVTLSFWVRSNTTGTFGGSLQNSAQNRSYPFTYSISSANTWEQKSITIAGDTSGTWLTTTGVGVRVTWSLGTGSTFSGTAGAWAGSDFRSATGATSIMGSTSNVFYITGVQLEAGSVATPFERRPYGAELALCQRYLPAWNWVSGNDNVGFGYSSSTVTSLINVAIPVTPRVAPTGVSTSAMTNFILRNGSNTGGTPTAIAINVTSSGVNQSLSVTTSAGAPTLVAGQGAFLFANGAAQILFTGCEL